MSPCQATPHAATRTTGYAYEDADGVYVTTTTDPKRFTSRVWRHPGYGFVVQSNDVNGAATTFTYDTLGRKLSEAKPTGESTSTTYDDPNTLTVCGAASTIYPEDSQSRAIQVRVNAFGNETRRSYAVTSGTNVTEYTFYDSNGRVQGSQKWSSAVPTPLFQSSLQYDDLNRLLSDCHGGVDAPWSCKTNVYDGLTTAVTNEAGRVTTHLADGQGRDRVVSTVLATGPSDATFRYGPFGLLDQQQTADGQTDLAYDTLGRQISITRTGAGKRGTTYNAFGDVIATYKVASDNAQLEKLSYGRDVLGRVTSITGADVGRAFYWDAPASDPTVPGPNAKGKLVDVTAEGIDVHLDYYPSGLLKKKIWSATHGGPELASAQYQYDPQGRPLTITYPKASTWSNPLVLAYDYDPYLGNASRISEAGNSENAIWEVVTRGVRGEITAETMGVPLGSRVSRNAAYYASTGLLQTGSLTSVDASEQQTAVQFGYQYDAAGLASFFQQSGNGISGTWSSTFGYDNLGRLTRWGTGQCCNGFDVGVTYAYDSDGNMTTREWSGGGHGVLGYGKTATSGGGYVRTVAYEGPGGIGTDFYQADAWGRIFDTPAAALTYNAADEVTALTEKNGGRADTFYRDGLGARVLTSYGNSSDGQPGSQLFTYDDLTEVRQGSSGTEERCRVRANGKLVGELVRTSDGPTRSGTFYLTDKVGSVVAEATSSASSTTTVNTRARRDPFGNLLPSPETPDIPRDPATANQDGSGRLAFADHARDDNWGLIDMQARFYSPRLGRFIAPDPVIANPLDRRSFNPFAYVRNNPIAGADRQGMADDWDDQNMSGVAAALSSSMETRLQSTESEYRRRRPASGLQSDLGSTMSGDDGAGASSQAGTIAASMSDDVAEYSPDAPRRKQSLPPVEPPSGGWSDGKSLGMSTLDDNPTIAPDFKWPVTPYDNRGHPDMHNFSPAQGNWAFSWTTAAGAALELAGTYQGQLGPWGEFAKQLTVPLGQALNAWHPAEFNIYWQNYTNYSHIDFGPVQVDTTYWYNATPWIPGTGGYVVNGSLLPTRSIEPWISRGN